MEPNDAVVPDSRVYLIWEKCMVTIYFWKHTNTHGTVVLRKAILVNVMDDCDTNYCVAHSCTKRFLEMLLMIM